MKRSVVAVSLALALAAVGCRDRSALTSPRRLSTDFLDGSVAAGNPHFFFLPPIIGQPTFAGTFNPNLAPVVEICLLDVGALQDPIGCHPGALPISPGPVDLDGVNTQYHVDWHTDAPAVDPTQFYRIQVFGSLQAFNSGTKPLGFADIKPVVNGGQLKNVNTGEFIGLVDGRTLPIKFRIEQGATCFGLTDCVEQTLGPSTMTQNVVSPDGFGAVSFPPGYFNETVTLTIHRLPPQCLNTVFEQFEGCYNFTTSPLAGDVLGCLATPTDPTKCARVEVCLNVSGEDPRHNHVALFRSDPLQTATELPEARDMLISCTLFGPFPSLGLGPHGITDLARATWHGMRSALGRLLAPEPLFARSAMAHLGLGGLSCCFSNFAWAEPLQMSGPAIDPSGLAQSVPVRDSVLVQYTHGIEPPTPAAGVVVTFTPTQGMVSPSSVTTNSFGYAITMWTLVAGTNSMVATAKATGSPLTLTATGTTIQ